MSIIIGYRSFILREKRDLRWLTGVANENEGILARASYNGSELVVCASHMTASLLELKLN